MLGSMQVPTHRYLGRGGRWPRFELEGLAVDTDGALSLAQLPDLSAVSDPLAPQPGLEGPFGVGVDDDGYVYLADPTEHRILRVDACDGSVRPLPCLQGPGAGTGELDTPRGVAVGGGTLYIADSRNARIILVDLRSGQLRGVWGGGTARMPGRPAPPGAFIEPWDVAIDGAGRIYIADVGEATAAGGRRFGSVQRFSAAGQLDERFSRVLTAQPTRPVAPASVAVGLLPVDGERAERLLVLDRELARLLVYRFDGTLDDARTDLWRRVAGDFSGDGPLTLDEDRVYLTDASGRVLVFGTDGRFLGAVPAGVNPVAGLGLDCEGRLLAHPGAGGAILRASGGAAFATCGAFLAGPFTGAIARTVWQRVRLAVERLPEGAHVRIFTLTSDCLDGSAGRRVELRARPSGGPVPSGGLALCDTSWADVPACQEPIRDSRLGTPGRMPRGEWAAAPWDALDVFVANEPARHLWIAGVLQGDGRVTPRVPEMRVEHDRGGWIRFLPGLYRRDPDSRGFLEPFLLLFETVHEDSETTIDDLPRLFDPFASPDAPGQPWLDWLAGWFDFPLRQTWSEQRRRETVAQAFRLQARRGTIASLRRRIRLYADVDAVIIDGARSTGMWVLGATPLGFETRLTDAEAQGAVLGTTATIDRSHLIRSDEAGSPLVDGVTHCFAVQVYRADLPPDRPLERLRAVVEREKPAHTAYRICVIEPRMRVGYQATLGVDTIVAGPPAAAAWDGSRRLGDGTVLPETRPSGERRLGEITTEFRLA